MKISRSLLSALSFALRLTAMTFMVAGCHSPAVHQDSAATALTGPALASFPREHAFNDGWLFHRFEDGAHARIEDVPAAGWVEVTLPHSARLEPRVVNDQWQGDAFYRKSFRADPAWRDRTVLLRFEGAMMVAGVSLNGQHIANHQGGYLPFTVDISKQLRFGQDNEIAVHLDNRDNPVTGPKPLAILDFNMYGGLYREVRLFVRDSLHISDEMLAGRVAGGGIFVTYPEVSADRAEISVRTHVENTGKSSRSFMISHELMDGDHRAASVSSADFELGPGLDLDHRVSLEVPFPRLWSPRRPQMYTLATTISDNGRVVDRRHTRIGIRRIEITRDGFSINGEAMFLRGVNRHQEYPHVGYALSPQADYRDARLIKEAGFDYVRLSHYPHSRHFMSAADELGLVLLDAILGWQYYSPDPAFEAQVVQTCRDLIRRDRNHPSVIAWECSLNESPMPPALIAKLHGAVHEEYPGDQAYSAGWVPEVYDIYLQARQHRLPHPDSPVPEKPYVVSEYGDWEYYAQNAGLDQDAWSNLAEEARTSRQLLAHGEQRLLQQATNVQEAHNDNLSTPAFADGYWVMFDYNRGYADDLEASGIMSIGRLPKPAYHFFRSQRDADEVSGLFESGPMVHVANEWRPESPRQVRVYSNGQEVELFLNGRSLGRRSPDRNRISGNLRHPPFTFDTASFVPGTLEAVAWIDGVEAARHSVRTPAGAAAIDVRIAGNGVPPAPGDLLFVHARLADASGTTVPSTGPSVRFTVSGNAVPVGADSALAENGLAAILVRLGTGPGQARVTARSGELSGSAVVSPWAGGSASGSALVQPARQQ